MRDKVYNALAAMAILAFAAFILMALLHIGQLGHPANHCLEDEVWAPVHYSTPGASQDTHGVTRMCVSIEEM